MSPHPLSAVHESGAEGVSGRIAPSKAEVDTLFVRRSEQPKMSPAQRNRSPREGTIDPILKSWIDRVIVPALVAKWNDQHTTKKAVQAS
jgi:hypothetical protein